MKVNTLKKTISVAATAAMVAQFGFVMPASAEDVSVDILDSNYQVTVSDDGNVLSIPVTNNSGEASVVNAYIATYKNGLLNKIEVDSASIENAASETLSVEYDAPAAGETVKLFVWTDSNKPITASKVIAEGEEVSENPTDAPTDAPTSEPTEEVTDTPTSAPTEEATEEPSIGVKYTGTPAWTVVGGSTAMRDNVLASDRSQTKNASVHIQGGGSGDRYAYTTVLPEGVTADNSQLLKIDFYLNIAGSNTNASHFYIMSSESTAAPTSGVIMDLSYGSYLAPIAVNGTTIDCIATERDSVLRPTDEAKYDATGLVHYIAEIDFALKTVTLTVEGTETKVYKVDFVDMNADKFVGFASLQGRALSGLGIADVNVSVEDRGGIVVSHSVKYIVDGKETSEVVQDGEYITEVPSTDKTGYIFKGWKKDGDDSVLYTTDEIKAQAVTGDVSYEAVYESDPSYIEPLESVTFASAPQLLEMGADSETAADNIFSLNLTGELGTDLAANPDERVEDMNVEWKFDGFRTIASEDKPTGDIDENTYCDSYATLTEISDTSVNFAVRNQSFNYYGRVTATVTYNGKQITVSSPVALIGNDVQDTGVLLPRGGYISDFDKYADEMVGYQAATSADNRTASDVVTDNWAAYGGNTKTLTLASDESGEKFMRIEATGTNSSCFAANILDVPTGQVIITQDVRFHTADSSLLYKSLNPVTWTSGQATTMSVNFTGTEINLNGGEAITQASAGVWYRIVMSADVTSKLCYAQVYDMEGNLLGTSETVPFSEAGSVTPKYLCYRTPDKSTGMLDFNNVRAYVPTIDNEKFEIKATDTTLIIPEDGEASTTLTASAVSTEGYTMIGAADWAITDDTVTGVTITPNADNPQTATVSVTPEAQPGQVPIRVTIGGVSKEITLTLTGTKDSISFTDFTSSISIPLNAEETATYTYAAKVVNGDGEEIPGKTVTLALYDRNNVNEVTGPIEGVVFDAEKGTLSVSSSAKANTYYIRATSTNTEGAEITRAIRVVIHGLAFDFGADTEDAIAEGYTIVTPSTVYSSTLGYGIEGTATIGGVGAVDNADSDYLAGNITFKVNVEPKKIYKVTVNYQGSISSEYVNSDLSGVMLYNEAYADQNGTPAMTSVTYTIPVIDDVLDLSFASHAWTEEFKINDETIIVDYNAAPQIASIVIEKQEDKQPAAKPTVFTVGDSTIANNGSWAYVLNRDQNNYSNLTDIVSFQNNGRGGRNLSSYYTGGELRDRVLTQIRPGDYVMIGDMGTNGMGSSFEEDFNYYVDACIAMGAKVIINSYSPHGAVSDYAWCYDSNTNTFTGYRQDSYDEIVRKIYAERVEAGDENVIGFVDIGKMADASFNAYTADYADNGYSSANEAAQAIISCFTDHNHYSAGPLACQLMIEGYEGTPGIVSSIVDIVTADLTE